MSNGCSLILSEELGHQCFLGYEDAEVEELRDMVRLFRIKAVEATAQQQKVLEKLSSTTESVSLAQQCLQQLHEAEIAAAERADGFEEELESSKRQLQDMENIRQIHLQTEHAKLDDAHSELQRTEQRFAQTELLLAETKALAEERYANSERASAQLRRALTSEQDCAEMSELHQLAFCRVQDELTAAQAELEVERQGKVEAYAKREFVDQPVSTDRYLQRGGWGNLRQSAQSTVSSDLAPSELEIALSSVEWSTGFNRSCEFREKVPDVFDSCCDWTLGLDSRLQFSNKENALQENSLDYSKGSEKAFGLYERNSIDVQMQTGTPKSKTVLCVTQDPAAVPTPAQIPKAVAFKPSPRGAATAAFVKPQANANVKSNAVSIYDDDLTNVGMDDDECSSVATVSSTQDQIDIAVREGKAKGAGVRYLLGRKGSQGLRNNSSLEAVDEDHICVSEERNAQEPIQEPLQENFASALRASWAPGTTGATLGEPSLVLIDKLFDQCLERAGGHLQGAASVRRVLSDIAGSDEALPPQLDGALSHLGSSLDAEVSRAQFRAIVSNALELRQSQEMSRYETTGTIEIAPSFCDDAGQEMSHGEMTRSLRQSAHLIRLWSALPSWSLELGRTSCEEGNELLEGSIGTASEHWGAVESRLEKLREVVASLQQHGCDKFLQDGATLAGVVEDVQDSLGSFVRSFAEESRGRLQAAHKSTGRLLEQKRRVAEDMGAQLEACDICLQQTREECASLSSRLRAAEERSAVAEKLAADATASLAKSQEALASQKLEAARAQTITNPIRDDLMASTATIPCWQEPSQASLGSFEELVFSLRTDLNGAEERRDAAEAARRDAEQRLQALERKYEDDMRSLKTNLAHSRSRVGLSSSLSKLPMLMSGSGEFKGSHPDNLLEELKDAAGHCAYENALRVEETLRSELQEAREELERHWDQERELQTQQATVVAKDVAAIEFRLGQMHAGSHCEKVSFKRGLKQTRYVRLTFDCRRIEWAQNERGPFKVMPVQAILRVDFGDTSRAFRCFEFGHRSRPSAGRCFSICTPSRSLDLIAPSEREVEVWVLGLNEIIPYRLERQRFTEEEFLLRRAILRLEGEDESLELDCQSNATSSVGGTIYTGDGSESGSRANSGSRSISSRLGSKLRRL